MPHPWKRLRELAHVALHWHDGGPWGIARHSTQEISLRRGLTQAQRRSTLAHELMHLQVGPAIVGYVDQDEAHVRERTARWLITSGPARLDSLTDDETSVLNGRLDAAERGFPA